MWLQSIVSLSNHCQMVQYHNCNHMSVFWTSTHSYILSGPDLRLSRALGLKCGNNQEIAEILMFTISCPDLCSHRVLDAMGWEACVCVCGMWLVAGGKGQVAKHITQSPSHLSLQRKPGPDLALLHCTQSYCTAADRCLPFQYHHQLRADTVEGLKCRLTFH